MRHLDATDHDRRSRGLRWRRMRMLASMPTDQPATTSGSSRDPIASGAADASNQLDRSPRSLLGSSRTRRVPRPGSEPPKPLSEQYLSNRATQLQILSTRISNTKSIPASDASTLQSIVSNEQTGLEGRRDLRTRDDGEEHDDMSPGHLGREDHGRRLPGLTPSSHRRST